MKEIIIIDIENNIYFKNNPEYFLELKTTIEQNPKTYRMILSHSKKYLSEWIEKISNKKIKNNFFNINTKCYWIFNNLTDFPKCNVCQNSFNNKNVHIFSGYPRYCSAKCINNSEDKKQKTRQTCYKKFNASSYLGSIVGKKQTRERMFEIYGAFNAFSVPSIQQKIKNTNIEKIGYENPFLSPTIRQKIDDKREILYGNRKFTNREKAKQTLLKTKGVEYPTQDLNVRKKISETKKMISKDQQQLINQKKAKTYYLHFGVDHNMKNAECRKKTQHKYFYNGLFFDSAPELSFYIWLNDHNYDFEYQPNICFKYEFNKKSHMYFPDFRVEGNLIEIKGDHFLIVLDK